MLLPFSINESNHGLAANGGLCDSTQVHVATLLSQDAFGPPPISIVQADARAYPQESETPGSIAPGGGGGGQNSSDSFHFSPWAYPVGVAPFAILGTALYLAHLQRRPGKPIEEVLKADDKNELLTRASNNASRLWEFHSQYMTDPALNDLVMPQGAGWQTSRGVGRVEYTVSRAWEFIPNAGKGRVSWRLPQMTADTPLTKIPLKQCKLVIQPRERKPAFCISSGARDGQLTVGGSDRGGEHIVVSGLGENARCVATSFDDDSAAQWLKVLADLKVGDL